MGRVPKHLVVFPGYGVNRARANGADIEPVPISPVHGQSWPGMQVQLLNGWGQTNFGRRMTYDDYLRLLRGEAGQAGVRQLPGRQQIQGPGASQVSSTWVPTNQQSSLGVGMVAANVDLSQRSFYG